MFNFQSLLANNAGNVANAQMLLVMRWLNNEVINNKDYNAKYKTKRKIIGDRVISKRGRSFFEKTPSPFSN